MGTSISSLTTYLQHSVTADHCSGGKLDIARQLVKAVRENLGTKRQINNYLNIGGESVLQTGDNNTQNIILEKSNKINCIQLGGGERTQNVVFNLFVAEKKRAVEIEKYPDEDVTIRISIKRKNKNGLLEKAEDIEDAGLQALNQTGSRIIIEIEDTADMTVEEIRKGSIVLRLKPKPGQSRKNLIEAIDNGKLEGIVAEILRQDGVCDLVRDEELEVNVEVNLNGSVSQSSLASSIDRSPEHRVNNEWNIPREDIGPVRALGWLPDLWGVLAALLVILPLLFCGLCTGTQIHNDWLPIPEHGQSAWLQDLTSTTITDHIQMNISNSNIMAASAWYKDNNTIVMANNQGIRIETLQSASPLLTKASEIASSKTVRDRCVNILLNSAATYETQVQHLDMNSSISVAKRSTQSCTYDSHMNTTMFKMWCSDNSNQTVKYFEAIPTHIIFYYKIKENITLTQGKCNLVNNINTNISIYKFAKMTYTDLDWTDLKWVSRININVVNENDWMCKTFTEYMNNNRYSYNSSHSTSNRASIEQEIEKASYMQENISIHTSKDTYNSKFMFNFIFIFSFATPFIVTLIGIRYIWLKFMHTGTLIFAYCSTILQGLCAYMPSVHNTTMYPHIVKRVMPCNNEQQCEHMFKYDVFVSCSPDDFGNDFAGEAIDELEGKTGLRLFITDRDGRIGRYIPEEISRAIEESEKIIYVISSPTTAWELTYMFRQAMMCEVMMSDNSRKMLLVSFQDTQQDERCKKIMRMANLFRIPCIMYSQDKYKEAFWEKCLSFIKETRDYILIDAESEINKHLSFDRKQCNP